MKNLSLKAALFSLFFPISVLAEVVVTPFGVFDPAKNVKVSYNVKTENGVETKSGIVAPGKVSDKKELDALVKKLGSVKFVVSPEDVKTIIDDRIWTTMMKPDPGATAASFHTKVYNRLKSQIIVETRKYYRENIPGAVLPNAAFINEGGGSYVIVDKEKRPLGTLIISYTMDFSPPTRGEAESVDFIVLSKIPANWHSVEPSSIGEAWRTYQMPSGEKVCAKHFGKMIHVVSFKANAKITYTFNRLEKKE